MEASQHLARASTVEEQASTTLGLGRSVVVEVISEAGRWLTGGERSRGGVSDVGRVLLRPVIDWDPAGNVADVEGSERLGEGGNVLNGLDKMEAREVGELGPRSSVSGRCAPEGGAQRGGGISLIGRRSGGRDG